MTSGMKRLRGTDGHNMPKPSVMLPSRLSPLRSVGVAFPALCTALLAAGCGSPAPEEIERKDAVSRSASADPVEVTLRAWPVSLPFGQRAHVELEIVADRDVTMQDPAFETTLGEGDRGFEYRAVATTREPARRTPDGRLRWKYRYEIEFFLPGEFEIPGAEVSFVEMTRPNGDAGPRADSSAPAGTQSIVTDPLTLSVHPPDGPGLTEAELRSVPRLDPIELPGRWSSLWWILPAIIAVAAVVLLLLLRYRRRRLLAIVAAPVSAHEWARSQFARLVSDDLIGKGHVQEFHYRVSDIVRGYIERRFRLSAPEMTTEEFLASAANDRRFAVDSTQRLGRFLTACDLVKYACRKPGQAESDGVLRAAQDFVERTRVREEDKEASKTEHISAEERAA